MGQKILQAGIVRALVIILILALCLVPVSSKPVFAQSISDYFSYTYSVKFSTVAVSEGEVFYVTVGGNATCGKDLPVPVSEASITGRIVAEHQISGGRVTLNPGYTITITPCPNKKGETAQVSQVVPLQFPIGSQTGTYRVVGELIEAKVKFITWFDVTSYLSSSQIVGSVAYVSGSTGGGGVGGGASGPPVASLELGVTDVSGSVGASGIFTKAVVAASANDKCKLNIGQGTRGLTKEGSALTRLVIIETEIPHAPPANSNIIDLSYDLAPVGATFEPPITITITYDPKNIPQGVDERNLFIGMWDANVGEWVNLDSTVDEQAHTVSAWVSHFTCFSILAYTRPSAFMVSGLSITPAEVGIDEAVTISVLVTNSGNLSSNYRATLKINNVVVATKDVTMTGGASQRVTFTIASNVAGTNSVSVDSISGTFVVKPPPTSAAFAVRNLSITPPEVNTGEKVTVSVLVTNSGDLPGSYGATLKIDNMVVATKDVTLTGGAIQEVTFTTTKDIAGTYSVTVDGLSGTFVVKAPTIPPPINWWVIGGIIAAVMIAGLVVWLLATRQRA